MEAAFPPALRGAINSLLARSRGQLIRQEGYYVENLALDGTPFRLVLVVHRDTFLLSALRSSLVTAVLLVVTLAMMLVVTTRLTKREFIWPAQQLVSYIEEESQGSAVAIPPVPLAWRPWFSTIRHVFNAHTQLISIQQELDVARRMQQSIVPTRFPKRPDVTVFARMIAAKEVGGDFYDYFWLDDDHIGVVIADVSGKGVPAALFMAVARTLIRATAPGAAMPGRCLALTNDLLSQDNDATMFVTVFYGILNTRSGEMTYANAGHNAPHLVLPDGEVLPLARTGGMAMGVMEGVSYTEGSLVLSPGSTLFLYTDGVTEAFDRHGKEYTEARLLHQLRALRDRPIEQLVEEVIRSVNEFARDVPQADDITCLAIQRPFASAGTETAA
jgi:sigma-B regulation protein RsbU (phosphoserine phosphatase)